MSSSVSSSSNSEKTFFSCASLGGGDDPCAICSSLSNLSRLSLLWVHDPSSGNGIGCQPHVTKCGGPQSWQLLGSWVLELDSVWRGCVVSSGKIGLLSVRAFLTVKDFGLCGSWSFFLLFFAVVLLSRLVVSLCYFRPGSEWEGWETFLDGSCR